MIIYVIDNGHLSTRFIKYGITPFAPSVKAVKYNDCFSAEE